MPREPTARQVDLVRVHFVDWIDFDANYRLNALLRQMCASHSGFEAHKGLEI